MEQRSVTHHRWNDIPREELSETLARKLITGDRMMLAHVFLKKGAIVPRHSHENEQITYILEGGLRFWIGADESQVIDVLAEKCCIYLRMFRTKPKPSKIRSTWISLVRQDRSGWTRQMIICGRSSMSDKLQFVAHYT